MHRTDRDVMDGTVSNTDGLRPIGLPVSTLHMYNVNKYELLWERIHRQNIAIIITISIYLTKHMEKQQTHANSNTEYRAAVPKAHLMLH